MNPAQIEARLDLLQTTQNEIREALVEHREAIAKLAKLVPAVGTLAHELAELVNVLGLPTSRTLAAGFEPGQAGTVAAQIVGLQDALEEVTVQFAAQDARLRVMIEAGKSREPWSPSKLGRKIREAQDAAIATMRASQETARTRTAEGLGHDEPPLPSVNGRPLDLPPSKDETPDG